MKAITVLIYRNYSKMFKNWNLLVYIRKKRYIKKNKKNNFRYSKYNYAKMSQSTARHS
jgi:hypothetical protein